MLRYGVDIRLPFARYIPNWLLLPYMVVFGSYDDSNRAASVPVVKRVRSTGLGGAFVRNICSKK